MLVSAPVVLPNVEVTNLKPEEIPESCWPIVMVARCQNCEEIVLLFKCLVFEERVMWFHRKSRSGWSVEVNMWLCWPCWVSHHRVRLKDLSGRDALASCVVICLLTIGSISEGHS